MKSARAALRSACRRRIGAPSKRASQISTLGSRPANGASRLCSSTTAVPGEYRASRPLEIMQIDHTKVDLIVVDEQTREPLGRPWITLAMDIFTRMVRGFYLTMDNPSRLSVSLCLLHAVFDKGAWLREREIDNDRPIAGLRNISMSTMAPTFAARRSYAPVEMKESASFGVRRARHILADILSG